MRHVIRAGAMAASTLLLVASARGDGVRGAASAFFVSKSENRNQVHYAIRLDERCTPQGAAPVYPYWRMLERGPQSTEPLLAREQPAYGIREQAVTSRGERGGVVRVVLRALPSRVLLITSFASGDGCTATASLVIGGVAATLTSIHAQLRWPFGVEHLLLSGRALSDGHAVTETIVP